MKHFKQCVTMLIILSILAIPASSMAREDRWIDELRDRYNKYYQGLLLAARYTKDELPKRFTDLAEGDPDQLAALVHCAELFKQNLVDLVFSMDHPFDHPGVYISNNSYYSWKYDALKNELKESGELVYNPRMDKFKDSTFTDAVDTALYWGSDPSGYGYETSNHTVIFEDVNSDSVMFQAPEAVPLAQPVYVLPLLLSICSLENDFSFLEDIEYFSEFPGINENQFGSEFSHIEFPDYFFLYMKPPRVDWEDDLTHSLMIERLSQQ